MGVCDAHEAACGCPGTVSPDEGYLLSARFMQNSKVQERNIDIHIALYERLGSPMSREQAKLQIESVQGATPWLICEECADFLSLSVTDKDATKEAAKKWWKNKRTPGYMPGQKVHKKNKKPAYFMIFGNGFTPSEESAHFILRGWVGKVKGMFGKDVWERVRMEIRSRPYTYRKEFFEIIPEIQKKHQGQIIDDLIMLDQKTGKDMVLIAVWAPKDSEYVGSLLKSKKDKSEKIDEEKTKHGLKRGFDERKNQQEEAPDILSQMNYTDGYNLEDRIFDCGAISKAEAFKIFKQIVTQLDDAHSRTVFHGNIKPANILVSKDDKAKLADFDITQLKSKSTHGATSEKTPKDSLYLAPEQLSSNNPSLKSDIYSLAVSIYECIYGHQAFWKSAFRSQFVNGKPAQIQKLNDKQNEALLKALSHNPEDRHNSAKELLNDLWPEAPEPAEMQKVTFGHKESAVPLKKEPKAKNKLTIVIPVLSILLALIMGVGILNWQHQKKLAKVMSLWKQAQFLARQLKYKEAIAKADQLIKTFPDFEQANAAQIQRPLWKEALTSQEYWQKTNQFAEQRNYEQATYRAELFIKKHPNSYYIKEAKVQLLVWKRIIIESKTSALLSKAKDSKKIGDFDKALEHVLAAVKLDRNCSEAKTLRAEIESLKDVQRIAAEKENRFRSLNEKALSFEAEKSWESAIKIYQQALLIKENDQEVKNNLSTCWHNLFVEKAKTAQSEGYLNTVIDLYTKALSCRQVDSTQAQLEAVKSELQAKVEKERLEKELAKWLSKAQKSEADGNLSDAIQFYKQAQEYTDISLKEKIESLKEKIIENEKSSRFSKLLDYAKATNNRVPDKALQALEKALVLYPNNNEALALKKQIAEKAEGAKFNESFGHTATKGNQALKQTSRVSEKPQVLYPDREKALAFDRKLRPALTSPVDLRHKLTLQGHGGWITSAAFSPTGDRIVSGSFDLTVKIWDTRSGNCLKTLRGHSQLVQAVAFSPDGEHIASGDGWNHILKIWDAWKGTCLYTIKAHSADIHDLSFSPDGRYVASAGDDKLVKIWSISTGACIRTLNGHRNGVFCVAFSPDGKHIASGSWDKKVKIWEVDSGQCIRTLKGHRGTVESLSFSPDGSRIVSCDYWDRKIIIWDALNGDRLHTMNSESFEGFHTVAFSPDGNYIVSGNADGKVQIWNAETGECLKTIKAHGGFPSLINSVEFSPDGSHILSAGNDNLIKVWSLQ